jgi:hypothetical protein
MSFEIPSQVEIAGRVWRVYRELDAPKRLRNKNPIMYHNGTMGVSHFGSREIVLAHGMTQEETCVTLVHELLHAIYDASGDRNLGQELEERVIEAIDSHLCSVILQLLQFNTRGNNDERIESGARVLH